MNFVDMLTRQLEIQLALQYMHAAMQRSTQEQESRAREADARRKQAEFEMQRQIFEARMGTVIDGEARDVTHQKQLPAPGAEGS